ncbi:MAG: hypothetical protein ACXWID_07365 [Pyrinomonadaceae bacterium]
MLHLKLTLTCIIAVLLFWTGARTQTLLPQPTTNDLEQKRLELLSDLQILAVRAKQLGKPLARAMAQAEIADAAWWVDRSLAEDLLRDAYSATLPDEEEQLNLRKRPVGADPPFPTPQGSARTAVRWRVMKVAARDKALARELANSAMEKLGAYEAHTAYSSLASNSISENDYESAGEYIRKAIDADPTQINGPMEINQLASRNRAAADELILAYIDRLSSANVSGMGRARGMLALSLLVNPQTEFWGGDPATPLPGPRVMRAYVAYRLNYVAALERERPESIFTSRATLLGTYPLLNQYAKDLQPQFLELEQRSRRPGERFSLPTERSLEQDHKDNYEKLVKRELENDHPDEMIIQRAIGREDFAKARKMIDKLEDGPRKVQLLDLLNIKQALSLVTKGEIEEARRLAQGLVRATSILQVFPAIINKCTANKDDLCVADVVEQAIKQLRKSDTTPVVPPAGIPASVIPTGKTYDPVLASLGKLALSVMALDDLAFDVIEELTSVANRSELDTGEGYVGFENSLFKKLAEKDEVRATSAAMTLKNPLQQIVALACVNQWKSARFIPNSNSLGNVTKPKKY